jgi:hypothetical protein
MLTLKGTIRSATQLGGGVNKKTGEVIAVRSVVQVEGIDSRGLVQLYTLTVPDHRPYEGKTGDVIEVPVRAWAVGAAVNLSYEARA